MCSCDDQLLKKQVYKKNNKVVQVMSGLQVNDQIVY